MIDESHIPRMRESLDSLRKDIADFHADLGVDWCPDSRAAVEFSQAKIPDLVTTNWSSSFFLIELGFEHLSSLIRTMEEPLCPLACGTCVRSMLESCSIASWLLQPNITPHERIGRGYAYRYSGMEQYAKYLRENHPGSSALDQLKGRICEVEREAVSLGYTEVANKEGKRIGIGRRMPSATEVIKLMLAHGGYYRILSAVSHGHNWAIRSLGFALVASAEAPTSISSDSVRPHTKIANPIYLNLLGLIAVEAVSRPVWNRCLYGGWDKERLAHILDVVADRIGLKPNHRFWRTAHN